MHHWRDVYGVGILWLAFMTVSVSWTVRIATLLHRQRRAEHFYRHQIAVSVGRAVRESGRAPKGTR